MKYELIKKALAFAGRTLYRIRDLLGTEAHTKAGGVKGRSEKPENFSQVEEAKVYRKIHIYGDAKVYGNNYVYGDAKMSKKQQLF